MLLQFHPGAAGPRTTGAILYAALLAALPSLAGAQSLSSNPYAPCHDRIIKRCESSAMARSISKPAEEAAGDEKHAIASLEKCISLDRYDYRPYRALAQAYSTAHLRAKGKPVVDSFLLLNPQIIVMRAQAD